MSVRWRAALPEQVRRAGLRPPALLLAGEVVRFQERLNWFEGREVRT